VIGTETLARVADPHDMDCMIYSDGAGATLLEATNEAAGILSHVVRSVRSIMPLLRMRTSYDPRRGGQRTLRQDERPRHLPVCRENRAAGGQQNLEKSGLGLGDIKRILIHQANEKWMRPSSRGSSTLQGQEIPADIMPMIISWTGNSSVATLPTLLDLIMKGK
jgi:3-oxoacyl-[acyl-carrier-protein] synthase-3